MSNDTTFEDLKKDYNDLSIDKPSIISSTEREKMLLKTARSLPDNPADSGMKASAVKPKFYSFATDTADSLYAYFNRAVGVINTAFDNIIEKINTQFGDNKDQIDDILDAITTFKTTYSTYVAQMKTTIDNINDNIESVEEDISDINDDIGTSISGLEESISTTNGRIDDTNQSISDTNTNLATTNSNLETTNTNLSNEITNRENAISGLLGNASEGYNTLGSLQSKLLEAIDTLNTTISNHSNATGNIHSVYGNQVAMSESNAKTITSALNDLATQIELLGGFNDQTSADFSSLTDRLSAVENHTSNTSNPHSVTKAQVGLGSVDNTSDINKPVSTAQASAIATAKSEATAYADTLSDKLKYKLGAFDTVSGNTITRQTGYITINGSEVGWSYQATSNGCIFINGSLIFDCNNYYPNPIVTKSNYLDVTGSDTWLGINGIAITDNQLQVCNTSCATLDAFRNWLSSNNIVIEYKLATGYHESNLGYSEYNLYHNELLKVAKEQANWFDISKYKTTYATSGNSEYTRFSFTVFTDNTYTTSITNTTYIDTNQITHFTIPSNDNYYLVIGINGNVTDDKVGNYVYFEKGIYTITANLSINSGNNANVNWIMINKGIIPMPYQPHKGSLIHSTDLEAVKNDVEALQTNVSTNTSSISTNSSNISTIQTSIGTINSKLLTYIDCELDENDDISCTFDTSVITKDNAQNYAVKMKVYNSDSEQHNYQYLYFDRIECKEIEGTPYYGFFDFYYGNANHTFLLERTINGANAIDEVAYENGYNVKNATTAISAMKADYASDDHTKGTIEERLTTLGFKEGVMSLNGYLTTSGTAPNTVKKQGKYCIASLDVNSTTQSVTTRNIIVPEGFRPKQATQFYLYAEYNNLSGAILTTISTDGVITVSSPLYGFATRIIIRNAGWELA